MVVLTGGRWAAAVLAPWAIAPHPNFSNATAGPEGLLALVADGRWQELDRYQDEVETLSHDMGQLITAARESLFLASQESAAQRLVSMAKSKSRSAGERFSAAMFAAVALVELDRVEDAVEALRGLEQSLSKAAWPDDLGGTRDMILEALRMQLAFRLFELEDRTGALSILDALVELPRDEAPQYEQFAVSKGIGWRSSSVQKDIRAATRNHVDLLRSKLEGLGGDTWMRVVRSKSAWPDQKLANKMADSDRSFVDLAYEYKLSSLSRKVTYRSGDPVLDGVAAGLLAAELSANVVSVLEGRERRARLLLLQSSDDPWAVQEALKLFRLARATSPLSEALEWVRSHGPNQSLVGAASAILARPSFPTRLLEWDVLVLGYAADFFKPESSRLAVSALLRREERTAFLSWKARDDNWKAIARLLPGSRSDALAARSALEFVRSKEFGPAMYGTFFSVADALDWRAVDDSTRNGWLSWASEQTDDSTRNELAGGVLGAIAKVVDLPSPAPLDKLNKIISEVNEVDLRNLGDAELDDGIDYLVGRLKEIRTQAAGGTAGFGGVDDVDLAVAFAAKFGAPRLWDDIVETITDLKVNPDLKARGLDRIARLKFDSIPARARNRLGQNWLAVIDAEKKVGRMFGPPGSSGFPEAIRAGAATRTLSAQVSVTAVTSMAASGSAEAQAEAARSIVPVASSFEGWEWGHAMLLQLAGKDDPVVKGEAARSLAYAANYPSRLSELVDGRLEDLLLADGVLVPLLAIRGLQSALQDGAPRSARLMENQIRELSLHHPSRVVRESASYLLGNLNERSSRGPEQVD